MNKQEEALKALNDLKKLSNNLETVDYSHIIDLIANSIRFVPITLAKLHKGTFIDRVRMNKSDALFTKEADISYIKNKNVIDNCLTEFGRANKPHEVMFYGAIESTQIDNQGVTALVETCDFIKDINSVCIKGQLFTISRWEVLEELTIAEMVFSDNALSVNPDTQKAFSFHNEKFKEHPMRELALLQLQFFCNQYARQIGTHEDYKISVAYTQLQLSKLDLAGITYPSVAAEYKGQNIVLKPKIVDEFLKLKGVCTKILYKNGSKSFAANHKCVSNIDADTSSFTWVDSKNLSTSEEIRKAIGLNS